MNLSRRELLQGLLAGSALALWPRSQGHALMAAPGPGARALVLIDLKGGNDGLNTVVPHGLAGGTYSTVFRPTLGVDPGAVLPLSAQIGLHPALTALKSHFDAGRLAVVQGVGHPQPSFSHELEQRVWQSGDPTAQATDGWLGRHLALQESTPLPDTVTVNGSGDLLTSAPGIFAPAFKSLSSFDFPIDGSHKKDGPNRRAAYAAMAASLSGGTGAVADMAHTSLGVLDLIDLFATVPDFAHLGDYPDHAWADRFRLVARLLAADVGMRHFHLPLGGFDTHADQNVGGDHPDRIGRVSACLDALYTDLASVGLAQDTLFVVFSEFGRTVYENGSGGTDHGAVNPVLVLGDGVQGGLVTEHPSMEPADLDEHGELPTSVDLRDVWGTIVEGWLGGSAAAVFPGHTFSPIPFLT